MFRLFVKETFKKDSIVVIKLCTIVFFKFILLKHIDFQILNGYTGGHRYMRKIGTKKIGSHIMKPIK